MKKVIYTTIFILGNLIFSGCVGKQTSIPKTLDEFESCTYTLFEKNPWIVNPTVENKISAVGVSHLSKAGMEFSIPQAEINAKAKIAGQIQMEISRLSKEALGELKIDDMDNFQARKELIKRIPLSGIKIINMKVGCGVLYIHMAIEKRDIIEQLKNMQDLHKAYMEKAKLERAMLENEPIINELIIDNEIIYTVYYGTNRKYNGEKYTNERGNKINYGKSEVFIPKNHKFGSIGSSWFDRWKIKDYKLIYEDDRIKVINNFSKDKDSFFEEIKGRVGKNDALIYIHGYNTSFEEATIRAAQIGFDLKVPLTAFFSWPSKGNEEDYPDDETTIKASEKYIVEFLENFTKNINPERIHIIAHSMGNRGLLRAFQRMFSLSSTNSNIKFGQIFLAAPDIDVDIFKDLAKIYPKHSKRTTLYVSKKDNALKLSKGFHDYPRVGLLPPPTIVNGIDTVEVTNIDISMLGHSYFGEAEALLYDIKDLILNNKNPNDRIRLKPIKNYWQFTK